MYLIDTRKYDDSFLLAKILEKVDITDEEKKKLFKHFEKPEVVDAEPKWIPITTRPMNTEERLEWEEEQGFVLEDDDAWIYTSQLPDDGQEVLVCGRYGAVWIDKFMNDPAYGCWLAETGDLDGIVAWMPLPKPYGEEEEDE